MVQNDALAVARAYFSAINETRLEDLAKLFTEDAQLSFPQLDPIQGRKAIRDFYQNVLQFYPERKDVVTRYFISDSGDVAAEIQFQGKTATGRSVIFEAVDLFRVHGGQIPELKIFYDSAKVTEMIGELPK